MSWDPTRAHRRLTARSPSGVDRAPSVASPRRRARTCESCPRSRASLSPPVHLCYARQRSSPAAAASMRSLTSGYRKHANHDAKRQERFERDRHPRRVGLFRFSRLPKWQIKYRLAFRTIAPRTPETVCCCPDPVNCLSPSKLGTSKLRVRSKVRQHVRRKIRLARAGRLSRLPPVVAPELCRQRRGRACEQALECVGDNLGRGQRQAARLSQPWEPPIVIPLTRQ